MTQYTPKIQEEYSAKLPALTLLTNLGGTFLSPELPRETKSQKTFYRAYRFRLNVNNKERNSWS